MFTRSKNLSTKEHPVWQVYDLLRTAKLNEKYFGRRLKKYVVINNTMEFFIAATASTSAIASLTVWSDGLGSHFWQGFLITAAVISVLKPIVGITKRVRLYEEVLAEYRVLSFELSQLRTSIATEQSYKPTHQTQFKKILAKHSALVAKTPESTENKKVKQECEQEVLSAFPISNFYIPES